MFIYLITNAVNSKIYVGQHKGDNLKHYLQQKCHEAKSRLKARSALYAAIRKYGNDAFSIEALAEVHGDMPKLVLNSLETFCISVFDARNRDKGYNICRGGEGFTGPQSAKMKADMSVRMLKQWQDPEYREKIIAELKLAYVDGRKTINPRCSHKGHKHSEATKKKMRDAKLKNPTRYWLGKTISPDHRAQLRAAGEKGRANRKQKETL